MVKRSLGFVLLAAVLAGSGCAALSSDPNTRTPGSVLDDQIIEGMVKREIWKADPDFNDANLVVVSFNGVLLLTGQVASEALRLKAEEISKGLEKVSRVHNELEIGVPTSMVARANDGWLTTKVKAKMAADAEVMARKLKVVTENGVVYLMGIVTREEADRAVELAASVFGVQKIVKVFEYV
ncbi:MAG: BON domain-containing protein [Pseudomonadales bacterium]